MRWLAVSFVVLFVAGCAAPAHPYKGPSSSAPGWHDVDAPSFPNATLATRHGDDIVVVGDRIWVWNVASGAVASSDRPAKADDWTRVVWNGTWRGYTRTDESWMYAVPCNDFPGCHGDGLHVAFNVTRYDIGPDAKASRYGWWLATDHMPGPREASHLTVAGATRQYEVSYDITWPNADGQIQTFHGKPCLRIQAAAVSGDELYILGDDVHMPTCTDIGRHVWHPDIARGVWQISAEAAPVAVGRRPIVWMGDHALLLGATTLAWRPGEWWDVQLPDTTPSATRMGSGFVFSIPPIHFPWGDPEVYWTWGTMHATGFSASFASRQSGPVDVLIIDKRYGLERHAGVAADAIPS
ncbi:MAG: hypothetical protein V4510_11545 [bacterium]